MAERLKAAHLRGELDAVENELRKQTELRPAIHAPPPVGTLLRDVAADWMTKSIERRRKRPEQMRIILDKHVLRALGDRPINNINPQDCEALVEAVAKTHPVMAGHVLASLRQLFKFARRKAGMKENPVADLDAMELGCVRSVCNRYLSAEEIPVFWHALDRSGMSPTTRAGLRVLLCTAVRSCELLLAEWKDVDLEAARWRIPVEVQKLSKTAERTAKPWMVPLSSLALEQFRELKALAGESRWVMASDAAEPGGHVTGKALSRVMARVFGGKAPLVKFEGERPTPHDLRRSVRSHMGGTLSIPWHVSERVLNHALPGVSATYDASDYYQERALALERWAQYLRGLISPSEATVSFLSAPAA